MSYHLYRIGLTGLGGTLVGCAYPALQMGEGAGGSSTTGTALVSGGSTASGGTLPAIASGGALTATPGSGGAATTLGNGGAVTTTAKGGNVGIGGAVTTTAKGGNVGIGGALASSGGAGVVTPGSGGVVTTATTVSSAGNAGALPNCSSSTNLIPFALSSDTTNWIGGDPAVSTDDPCGVQGAIYAYSDNGLDKVAGNADDSVQSPAPDPAAGAGARLSPCAAGSCCISGTTSKWPVATSGTTDYTASVWGGGIALSLGDPGGGGTKWAYPGPVRGFNITLSGTLNGQVVRLGYTQSAADEAAPFKQITSLGLTPLLFTAVTCPTWTSTCVMPGLHPYDLQIQVVGGDAAGAFKICIDSIVPIF